MENSEVRQEVRIDGNRNCITQDQSTNIQNNEVNVAVSIQPAPLRVVTEDDEIWREIELHNKFKAETGIECSRPARRALEPLLLRHNFTPRQLRIAWRNGDLVYDEDTGKLQVRPSNVEAMYGLLLFVFGMLLMLGPVLKFLFAESHSSSTLAAFYMVLGGYTLVLAMAARYHIVPWRIAKRLQRVIG